ncbi:MAG: amino acid permease [Candidatus Marinimicrobia bacterium]|nr:amino acid permease [Candidatus Neomarinimicrobiota bacterium]
MVSEENRHLSLFAAVSLVISSMVGTGVFTSLGYQLVDIQSVFAILMLWLIGGVISLFGALSYCELASALPKSGGEYYLLSRILHPSIGLSAGLVSATVGFSAPAVLAAIALANYLNPIMPFMNIKIIAIFVILFMNLMHAYSLDTGKSFQVWSTFLKLFIIFSFVSIGFLYEDKQSISFIPKYEDFAILLSPEFAVNLVWVSYAYAGWNSSIYVVGEIIQPNKNIFRSILIGTLIVTALYVLLNYVFLLISPIDVLMGKIEIGYISSINLFGFKTAKIVSIFIGLLLLSTVSSYVYIGPRIIQAIGKDYEKINFLSKVNKKGVPLNAFSLQLFISLIFIISSTFEEVMLYTGIILIITTSITVCSLIYLRIKEPNLKRAYKVWGYPFTPIIFIILNTWILYYTIRLQPFESLIGVCLIVISLGLYFSIKTET